MEEGIKKTPNGNDLLFEGFEYLTKIKNFIEKKEEVSKAAFTAVFKAQANEELQWKRNNLEPDGFPILESKAVVRNLKGEAVTMPVFLFMTMTDMGDSGYCFMLGSMENAPGLNGMDSRVVALYAQVTGRD